MNVGPNGKVYPCCHALQQAPVGDCNKDSLEDIFNQEAMRRIRKNMLQGKPSKECVRCYFQEKNNLESDRDRFNKKFSHLLNLTDHTKEDGSTEFNLKYFNFNISNLCNLKCRSCGPTLSSSWYEDQIEMDGKKIVPRKFIKAGRNKQDILDQILPHVEEVEECYWAGGEPILIEENYLILKKLHELKKFKCRLRYNTNFTNLKYKDKEIMKLWRDFEHVFVGASLDAEGTMAEYLRKGTVWQDIIDNRKKLKQEAPNVKFTITATVGLINCFHIMDFHRHWVEQAMIGVDDFTMYYLTSPSWQKIDLLPEPFKNKLVEKYNEHIDWLKENGSQSSYKDYENFILLINKNNNVDKLDIFWERTLRLDKIRNESIFDHFPEMKDLYNWYQHNLHLYNKRHY